MSEEAASQSGWWKKNFPHYGGILLAVVSFALLILSKYYFISVDKTHETSLYEAIAPFKEEIFDFFRMGTFFGFGWFVLFQVVSNLWSEGLKGSLSQGFDAISNSVNKGILGLRKEQITSAIIQTMSPKQAKGLIIPILSKSYGDHVEEKDGLGDFLVNKYLCFLKEDVFVKDEPQRDITVTKDGDEYWWTEYDHFSVKIDNYEKEGVVKEFILPYISSFRIPDTMSRADFMRRLECKIEAGGPKTYNTVFDIQEYVDEKGNVTEKKSGELSIEEIGSEIIVKLNKRIRLVQEVTQFKFNEHSLHDPSDCSFTLIGYEAQRDLRFSLVLPSGWVINKPLIARAKLDGRGSEPILWQYQGVNDKDKSRIRIHVKDWTLPGIVLTCNWITDIK